MPKISQTRKFVLEFGENVFSTDGTILFCKICEVKVNCEKGFTVTQDVKTNKHERLLNRQRNSLKVSTTQQFLSSSTSKKCEFSIQLKKLQSIKHKIQAKTLSQT